MTSQQPRSTPLPACSSSPAALLLSLHLPLFWCRAPALSGKPDQQPAVSVCVLCTCMYAKSLAQESVGHPWVQRHRGRGMKEWGEERGLMAGSSERQMMMKRAKQTDWEKDKEDRTQGDKENREERTRSMIFILTINSSYWNRNTDRFPQSVGGQGAGSCLSFRSRLQPPRFTTSHCAKK